MESKQTSIDVLGIAPLGQAINTVAEKAGDIAKLSVEKSFDAAAKFYNDICQPAAAEAGLLLRDKVRIFRAKNLASIAAHAQKHLEMTSEGVQLQAPPRLVAEVIESGSWCGDEELQKLWAGLLASSATQDGKDDTSTIFTNILKQLIPAEAKLVEFACERAVKVLKKEDVVRCVVFGVSMEEIRAITALPDVSAIQLHVGHLHTLGLIVGGGEIGQEIILNHRLPNEEHVPNLTPQPLALQFYVRCKGSRKTVKEFFNVTATRAESTMPKPYAIKQGAAVQVESRNR